MTYYIFCYNHNIKTSSIHTPLPLTIAPTPTPIPNPIPVTPPQTPWTKERGA